MPFSGVSCADHTYQHCHWLDETGPPVDRSPRSSRTRGQLLSSILHPTGRFRTNWSHDVLKPSFTYLFKRRTAVPLDLLQPQDEMRGPTIEVPNGLPAIWTLGHIQACYPRRTFTVEAMALSTGPPDHDGRLSTLLDLSVSQSGWLLAIALNERFPTALSHLRAPSVTL